MRSEFKNKVEWVTIEPGEYFTSNEKIIISTLLGSCVSACLWDPVHKIAGMNHFLLSSKRYKKKQPCLRFRSRTIWCSCDGTCY